MLAALPTAAMDAEALLGGFVALPTAATDAEEPHVEVLLFFNFVLKIFKNIDFFLRIFFPIFVPCSVWAEWCSPGREGNNKISCFLHGKMHPGQSRDFFSRAQSG